MNFIGSVSPLGVALTVGESHESVGTDHCGNFYFVAVCG